MAVPTETVYGLAARADDPHVVARIYAAKGRPADHPLIVHVADANAMEAWARTIPEYARGLAIAFWPGPMTLVVPRSDRAGDFITGGHEAISKHFCGLLTRPLLTIEGHLILLTILCNFNFIVICISLA